MPAYWEPLYTQDQRGDYQKGFTCGVRGKPFYGDKYEFDWMVCFNDACKQVIVRVQKRLIAFQTSEVLSEDEWYAVPRKGQPRTIDPLVPDRYKLPYVKASLILEDAPDMSGVLSRRILQDLLKEYAGRDEYKLEDRIKNFVEDTSFSCSTVKENLHHLREIGNFAAHTKENNLTSETVEIGPDEAAWALDVIDGLFDYFIVGPEKNRQKRTAWEQKRGPQNPPSAKKL
ncbi:MAG: DUF4145 domain-containing protein [Candidatus Binataceae bacterium]